MGLFLPVQDDIVWALLARQLVCWCDPRHRQKRFQQQGQTVVDCVRNFYIPITPVTNTYTNMYSKLGNTTT